MGRLYRIPFDEFERYIPYGTRAGRRVRRAIHRRRRHHGQLHPLRRLDEAGVDAVADLKPWQCAFAAAAYNGLQAGLESGTLRDDCYGSGAICPTDASTVTPSDVLLTAAIADGSGGGFDSQVAAASSSTAAAAAVFSGTAIARELGKTGEAQVGLPKNSQSIRVAGGFLPQPAGPDGDHPRPNRHIRVSRRDRLSGLLHEYAQVA
jgi:hypothetical protein